MSSLTHEATIKLNLDFVDSTGLNQLKAALKSIKDALDMTKFDDRVAKLEQDLAAAKAQVMELTGALKQQAAAQEVVAAATAKQTKNQKAAEAAARRAVSVQNSTMKKFQGVSAGSFDESGRWQGGGPLPAGLAGDWKQRMTGMATNLKTLKTAMAGTEDVAGNLARGMATVGRMTSEAAKKTQSADDAFKELGNEIKASTGKGKQYTDQMKQIKAQYAALEGQEEKNIATITRLRQKVKEINDAEKQHQDSLKSSLMYRLSYYEKQVDAVYRASYRLAQTGTNLTMFGRRILDTGAQFMQTFGDYQLELNRAAGAVSIWEDSLIDGQDATGKLSDSIVNLAGDMKIIPAKEVAEAFYYWGSATGAVINSTDDLEANMGALDKIMKASIMTNTGYEDTIKGVYSILTQFYNGSLSKASDVTEELFYVTQKTAVEFNDLIQAFKMVGPVAAQAGATFEDMVDLLGRLGDLGIRGSMAGRAFRQMFIQMVRPSGPAKKAINNLFTTISTNADRLGDKYKDFKGKSYLELMFPKGEFVGTQKYIHNLALAVDTLTQSERNAFLGRISTANELPVVTALITDEIKKIHGLAEEAGKTQDLTTESSVYFRKNWERFSSSWKATVGSMQRAWERIQIVAGGLIAKALTPFANKITEIADAVKEWVNSPANAAIIQWLSKLAAGAAIVASLTGAILTLMGALAGLGASAYLIINTFGKFMPTISAFTVAAGALITGLVRNFGMLRDAVEDAIRNLQSNASGGVDMVQALADAFNALSMPMKIVIDLFYSGVAIIIKFVGVVGGLLEKIGALKPILMAVGALIGTLMLRNVLRVATAFAKARIEAIAFNLELRKEAILKAGKGMSDLAVSAATATGALAKLKIGASAAWAALGGPIGIVSAVIGIGSVAYEVFPAVKDFVDGITSAFRDTNKEARDFMTNIGDMGVEVDANFKKLADARYADQFQKNLEDARQAVAAVRDEWAKGSDNEATQLYQQGFINFKGANVPIENIGGDPEAVAQQLALAATPSADAIQTALTDQLKTTLNSVNTARIAREVAPVADSVFAQYVVDMKGDMERVTGLTGQADFASAIAGAVMTQLDPTATRDQVYKVVHDQLQTAWDPNSTWAKANNISQATIDAVSNYLTDTLYDKASVDKSISDKTGDAWGKWVGYVADQIGSGAIDEDAAKRLLQTSFGYKGGPMKGSLADVFAILPEEMQKQLSDALQQAFGTSEGNLLDADTEKTIQTMTKDKYTALTTAATNAIYMGYQQAELASQDAYDSTMEGLSRGDFDPALKAVLGLENTLRNRAISPDAYDAWANVIDLLVKRDMLDQSVAKSIKNQIAPKVKETVLTTAQQVAQDIAQVVADNAPDFQNTFDTMLTTLGQVYRGEFNGKGGLEGARDFFMRTILPNYTNPDLTDDQRKFIEQYASTLFPDVPLAKLIDPVKYKIGQFDGRVKKAIDYGIGLIGKIYAKYSTSGTSSMLEKATSQGQTVANNSNPAYQQGYQFIEQFAQAMALGTEAGYNKAIQIYVNELAPRIKQMPDDVRSGIKSSMGVAEGALNIKVPISVQLQMQEKGFIGPANAENAAKTRRQWAQQLVEDTIPTHADIVKALSHLKSPKQLFSGIKAGLNDPTLWKALAHGGVIRREHAKQITDGLLTDLQALANSGDANDKKRAMGIVHALLNDPKTPKYMRTQLQKWLQTGIDNVEVDTPKTPTGTGKPNLLDSIWKMFGLDNAGKTTKDKPANVYLKVHVQHAGTKKTVTAVQGAYDAVTGFITAMNALDWTGTGNKAGKSLADGFVDGLKTVNYDTEGQRIKNTLRSVAWWAGGHASGVAWATGFNGAINSNVLKTVKFIASVTIGESPPKAGPLKDIDKGGRNIGTAWGDAYGKAAVERVTYHAQKIRDQKMSDRMSLKSEETYNAKKEISIHMDVSSKDGSVDRAKQGEFRRGAMDALVAADLEHYVTVS